MKQFFKKLLKKLGVTIPPVLHIIKGDITKFNFECIVNAANKELRHGSGVCGSIYEAAGPRLKQYQKEQNIYSCEIGSAVLTPGFDSGSMWIVHAVGPIYYDHTPEEARILLKSAYKKSLELAEFCQCKQIAFPLISTGVYGYPLLEGIKVAIEAIVEFSGRANAEHLKEINIVCFTEGDYLATQSILAK